MLVEQKPSVCPTLTASKLRKLFSQLKSSLIICKWSCTLSFNKKGCGRFAQSTIFPCAHLLLLVRREGLNIMPNEAFRKFKFEYRNNVKEFIKVCDHLGAPTIPAVLQDPVVEDIARAHSKSPAQILLRHLAQQGIAVIPKSINRQRIKENFDVTRTTFTHFLISHINFFKCCRFLILP